MRAHIAFVATGAVVLVGLLGGCSTPAVGLVGVGVGVDDQGQPVGYLAVCSNHVDGTTLSTADTHTELGSWDAPTPVTGSTSWSMADPQGGWTVRKALAALQPGVTYDVSGWSDDDRFGASTVEFTTADLATMAPGQVRYQVYDAATMTFPTVVGTQADFHAYTCAT